MGKIEIEEEKLDKLISYFWNTAYCFDDAACFCSELNIYEREEANERLNEMYDDLSDMKDWVKNNFKK